MKNRLVQKAMALAISVVVLMVGLMLIGDVVRDRIHNRDRAVQGVVNSTAGAQTILGPALAQSCTKTIISKDGEGRTESKPVRFTRLALPDHVQHQAQARMQARTRGLHQVNTFVLSDQLSARFNADNQLQSPPEGLSPHQCDAPRIILPISDPRGIRQATLLVNGLEVALEAGTGHSSYTRGLQSRPLPALASSNAPLHIQLKLELLGTERVGFVPLGSSNQVSMQADWPHPSFDGNFLPSQRSITDAQFDATWNISALASSARQSFLHGKSLCAAADPNAGYEQEGSHCLEQFGTSFIDPVNPYTLSDRATKYGLLFVVLTFVAVAMFEVLKKLRVHPVQYLLVGAALCIFFLLLISLSEHIGFDRAYAVAACACILLLGYYASHVLGSVRRGLPFAGLIALMYGLLFVLLQLEQTALVVGSLAMFAVLAIVMVATRKVDWYALGKSDSSTAPSPAEISALALHNPTQESA